MQLTISMLVTVNIKRVREARRKYFMLFLPTMVLECPWCWKYKGGSEGGRSRELE